MLVENKNEVEVVSLSVEEVKGCTKIAKAVHGAWSSGLKRDEFINQASDELIKITGKKPDYQLHKAIQAQTIQDLINLGLAVDSANTYYGYILQHAIAKHQFVKPVKNTKDSARVAESRKAFEEKFKHTSLENILVDLKEVNEIIAQDLLNGVDAKKEDIDKQKELAKARDWKGNKLASQQKELQKGNIEKLRKVIEKKLKIQTGVNKKGVPMFAWSIANLEFVNTCLDNQEKIKEFLSSK